MGAVHLRKGGATNTHECGGQGGYKIIKWSISSHALNELKCGKSNNENWKWSKNAYCMFAFYDNIIVGYML